MVNKTVKISLPDWMKKQITDDQFDDMKKIKKEIDVM